VGGKRSPKHFYASNLKCNQIQSASNCPSRRRQVGPHLRRSIRFPRPTFPSPWKISDYDVTTTRWAHLYRHSISSPLICFSACLLDFEITWSNQLRCLSTILDILVLSKIAISTCNRKETWLFHEFFMRNVRIENSCWSIDISMYNFDMYIYIYIYILYIVFWTHTYTLSIFFAHALSFDC